MTVTYNGERGKQNKWINYLFYPVHILILGILRFYLNIQKSLEIFSRKENRGML